MKIDVTQPLLNYNGEKSADVTFRSAVSDVLNAFMPEEKQTPDLKDRLYALTHKLYNSDTVEFTIKESALIIERAETVGSVIVQGEIKRILEPEEEIEEKTED